MSSKWVEIRDGIAKTLESEGVGKDLKYHFVGWVEDEGMAVLQTLADSVASECRKDAATESGWCKIRDAVVIPGALTTIMCVLRIAVEKSAAKK